MPAQRDTDVQASRWPAEVTSHTLSHGRPIRPSTRKRLLFGKREIIGPDGIGFLIFGSGGALTELYADQRPPVPSGSLTTAFTQSGHSRANQKSAASGQEQPVSLLQHQALGSLVNDRHAEQKGNASLASRAPWATGILGHSPQLKRTNRSTGRRVPPRKLQRL